MGDSVSEAEESRVFERFLQRFDFHNVRTTNLIRRGKPQEEILKVVDEQESDLLVAGSEGRTGLGRVWTGGVAKRVAREMPCSMITVRSEHAIRLRLDAEIADAEAHIKLGHELLALGFPEEAAREFRRCIDRHDTYVAAWEGLATAHQRLGRHEEARQCEEKADQIAQTLYYREIEADIRSQHPLFRPTRGTR